MTRAPVIAAYIYALVVAAAMGHFLLGIPIQFSDSFGNMAKLDASWPDLMASEFTQRAFLRPFLWAELKAVYDASGGNYFAWYRGVHVAQIGALVVLFLMLVQPRTWRDAALVPLGLAVLVGLHTFKGTVTEAFPVNTFLTIVLCCFAAAKLVLLEHRWWVDVLAVLLFVVAALTVESGLLVWVIVVGGAMLGARGVSRRGLAAFACLLAGYFVLRFAVLDVGAPGLIERASGYGFRALEPPELVARFGDDPRWFYLYNIGTSFVSVLFSEPRGGVFRLVYGFTLGTPEPSMLVNVAASTCATAVIAVYAWRRRRAWLAREFDHDDRLVLLFVMVLTANATMSYPYTKDVIMSAAGAFYAVAVFAAARGLLPPAPRLPVAVMAAAVCLVIGTTWAVRAVGMHLALRAAARNVRIEWAYVDERAANESASMQNPRVRALFDKLRSDAIYVHPPPPWLPLADNRLFDVH